MILTRLLLTLFSVFGLRLILASSADFPNALKIITEGSTKPNDITKFTIEHSHSRVDYVFVPGVNCTEIRFGDRYIWRTQDRGVKYPISITYVTDINQFAVRNDHISVIYHEAYGADWRFAYVVDNSTGEVLETENGSIWKNRFIKAITGAVLVSFLFLLNPIILSILIYQIKVIRDIRKYVSTGPDSGLLA
ncbi:hypothetical protein MACJ_002600 [Theileria orientalis]|uniref:Uncharacterized protein n=1 Tax=Theileria orientalis TaxID=68886 RepID=A0A976M7W2_THEOR|nr:hypothetical protein MACJ_002600 [Theileria orientalis]